MTYTKRKLERLEDIGDGDNEFLEYMAEDDSVPAHKRREYARMLRTYRARGRYEVGK